MRIDPCFNMSKLYKHSFSKESWDDQVKKKQTKLSAVCVCGWADEKRAKKAIARYELPFNLINILKINNSIQSKIL